MFDEEKALTEIPERPPWLDDEPEIYALLNTFLDRLEQKPAEARVRLPSIKLSKRIMPRLYHHNDASDRTWSLLKDLAGSMLEIRVDHRRGPYHAEYVGASLRLLPAGEVIFRAWLSRPRQPRYQEQWQAAVDACAHAFAADGTVLRNRPIQLAGHTAYDIVAAFARIADMCDQALTLRQLSARCFWGHSKLLDSREDLLQQLFPSLSIAPRRVMVHISLPACCQGVLFIENQDTYLQALSGIRSDTEKLALVYVAGFRGSAERIRTTEGVSLHYHHQSAFTQRDEFESWWFDTASTPWPLWFWGDLDYSGMAILKRLRQRFGDVRAWTPGYESLLRALTHGCGHVPEAADKEEQYDPLSTGCAYADERLLPAIREYGQFVDQELTM